MYGQLVDVVLRNITVYDVLLFSMCQCQSLFQNALDDDCSIASDFFSLICL